MKVLVTGGAGFIGSHVVDEFVSAGHAVRIMDNLGPPTHDGTVPEWLNAQAEFLNGDVRKKNDWHRALAGVDVVCHLAAYMDFHLDFSTYVRTNVESVALLFETIAEDNLSIKKIIMASSQSVYGEGRYQCALHGNMYLPPRSDAQLARHDWEHSCRVCGATVTAVPAKEDDLVSPRIPYGVSKLAAEQLLFVLSELHHIPAVALRYSIALGARQSFRHFYSGALRQFAVNVLSCEPIAMNEDGGQLRDFVHVADVAHAHRVAAEDSRADGQAFNVGSGAGTRVYDLGALVAKTADVVFEPLLENRYRVGGARHSLMDISKLKALGWLPFYALEEAVGDYLIWVKQFGDLSRVLKKTNDELKKEGSLKRI